MTTERREKFRAELSSLYLPFYDTLCTKLGPEWQPYCGRRSLMEQSALYLRGRVTPGPIVTYAKAGESPHNFGCASDWCLWEGPKPVWPPAHDPKWKEYLDAIEASGLRAGGSFSHPDYPHNELKVTCDWKHVGQIFVASGMRAAQEHIESNLVKV